MFLLELAGFIVLSQVALPVTIRLETASFSIEPVTGEAQEEREKLQKILH